MGLITAQVTTPLWCKQVCQLGVLLCQCGSCAVTSPPLPSHPSPTLAVPPSFLEDPSNVTAAIGDFISLNCTATGLPLPTIIWEDGEGGNITDDEVYNITTVVPENETVISMLEFVAFDGVNGSQFRCVAENRADRTESEVATIIIGGERERDTHTVPL